MTEKLPKLATVELDDDMRIVLAHMCEDLHLEPGIAINRLCIVAIYCSIYRPSPYNPCKDLLDDIYQAFDESVDELNQQEQRREFNSMFERLKRFEV